MKVISWNVNGIRAVFKKGFAEFLAEQQPDLLFIQETKAHPEQLTEEQTSPAGYRSVFVSAEKKGYSGLACYYRSDARDFELLQTQIELGGTDTSLFNSEGRYMLCRLGDYYFFNIYFPSGTTGQVRQQVKYDFLSATSKYISGLPPKILSRLIVCGDYNICHQEIDIHHPATATKRALSGFLPDERSWLSNFLADGFVDSFRNQHPEEQKFSWWSYRAGARPKNLGWRIDYFLLNQNLADKISGADILTKVTGSDHAPILLELSDA